MPNIRNAIKLIKVDTSERDELLRVKNAFYARGERISEWAQAHGFSRAMVYSVLSGRAQGRAGQAHLIAVELGLKARPINISHTEEQT